MRQGSDNVRSPEAVGPYRLAGVLGHGGMGVVYRAVHTETGDRVALKTVVGVEQTVLSSIRREIHALRRIDHPGVVRIVDEGLAEGVPWYAMDLLEGRTLRDYLASPDRGSSAPDAESTVSVEDAATISVSEADPARMRTVPSAELAATLTALAPRPSSPAGATLPHALGLFRQVCDTLAFVHGRGLVHRDLKPENVFIREGDAPVLVDFGLAQATSGAVGRDVLELGGRPAGSPPYMAPEQICGRVVDARCDLYALGVLLYECVTGRVPFTGTVTEVLQRHVLEDPEPPSSYVDIPPALEELILKLLQKQPEDRPGYADDVAAVLGSLGAPGRSGWPRCRPYLYRPGLAGRTALLAQAADRLGRPDDEAGACIFVSGESGIGKTRFALEVAALGAARGLRVITGECAAVAAGDDGDGVHAAPLHPFRPLLQAIADRCRERGTAETARLLGERGPVLAACEPSIARLPGQQDLPALPALAAQGASARLLGAFVTTLGAFSRAEPLLLVVDDLQWADESSLAFLRLLDADFLARHRVVVLGTYRSDEASAELRALAATPHALAIELGRIDAAAVRHIVRDMLAMRAPPASFVEFLVEQSEGNPFFVAEHLRASIDEGVLGRDESGVWRVAGDGRDRAAYRAAVPLPRELRALVGRRVAALSPAARAVARVASVLGREFDADVLAAATTLDEIAGLEAVEELRVRQILDVVGGRLRFAHDKLRESIFADMADEEARRLSEVAARAIEKRYAGTPEIADHYGVLAHHFATARQYDEALGYLEKAGERALDSGASGDALAFFRRAIEIDDERQGGGAAPAPALRRACWERRLGQAEHNLGHFREAERLTRGALDRLQTGRTRAARPHGLVVLFWLVVHLARQLVGLVWQRRPTADPERRLCLTEASLAAERLGEIYYFEGAPLSAFSAALLAANLAEGLGPSPELARGYATLALGFSTVPFARAAAAYEARATAAAEPTGDAQAISWVRFMVAVNAIGSGRWEVARQAAAQAIAVARTIQDHRRVEECLAIASDVEFMTGHYAEAMRTNDELYASARRSGNRQAEFWALSTRAWVQTCLGRADEAIQSWERLPALMDDGSGDASQRITLGEGSLAHLLRGQRTTALALAEDTLAHMRTMTPSMFHVGWGFGATCEVLLELAGEEPPGDERRRLVDAGRAAVRALRGFARVFPIGRPAAHRHAGLLHRLAGHPARATRALSRSLAWAERLAMPIEAAQAHYELGRLLPPTDPRRAEHLDQARRAFAEHGAAHWLGRVEAASAPKDVRDSRPPR